VRRVASGKETLKGVLPRPARSSDAFQTELVNTLEAHLEGRIAEARDAAAHAGEEAVFAGQVVLEALAALERTAAGMAASLGRLEALADPAERLRAGVVLALVVEALAAVGRDEPVLDLSPDGGAIAGPLRCLGRLVVRRDDGAPGLAAAAAAADDDAGAGAAARPADPARFGLVVATGPSVPAVALGLQRHAAAVPPSAPILLVAPAEDGSLHPLLTPDGGSAPGLPDELAGVLAGRRAEGLAVYTVGDGRVVRALLAPVDG
jgi:hypothetical protein